MISILIPIFNFDVTGMVSELYRQAVNCGASFEILCYDDGSEEKYKRINREITSFDKVKYVELEKNTGRSAIRNKLAQNAAGEYILFLDCDLKVTRENFIREYIENMKPDTVIFGGREYERIPPEDYRKTLRWHYGIKRESFNARTRHQNPYKYFMTNNFLIPTLLFNTIRFNENLREYGHEDTLFAGELMRKKIPLAHIENPICHIGLEDADEFLVKTRQGVANLAWLIKNNQADSRIKLYLYYRITGLVLIHKAIKYSCHYFEKSFLANLRSRKPNLIYFDILKLSWLINEMEKK